MSRRWLDSLFDESVGAADVTRRAVMKSGLAAGTGLLISASGSRAEQQQGKGRRVIVVGAGLAGLACADELARAGCDVTVVEARDRVGGRAYSLSDLVPGKVAEAGGEFVGANHPTFLGLAKRFQIEFWDVGHASAKKPKAVVLNGRRLTTAELKGTRPHVDFALNTMTDEARSVVPEQPWTSPDAGTLDKLSTAAWLEKLDIPPLARELVAAQLTANNGVSAERQSHLGNLSQIRGGGLEKYWTDSEQYRCRGGNNRLAVKLAESVGAARIHLQTAVKEISTGKLSVRVMTEENKVIEADDVVLCVPPSTWSRIHFDPPLPGVLRPQMGQAVKFLNAVKDHFWERHEMPPDSMSYGGIGHTWYATANQDKQDPREVLISFASGPAATKWSDHPAGQRIADFQRELESLQPGFAESVTQTRFIDWLKETWTQGGYSFPAPGQITTQGPILQRGIGRLHFAGEHTCYQFVGYMEGALRSGVDAAKRILKTLPAQRE
jgi:monoamine oxidase